MGCLHKLHKELYTLTVGELGFHLHLNTLGQLHSAHIMQMLMHAIVLYHMRLARACSL